MRTSNYFLIISTAIVVVALVSYLIFKTIGGNGSQVADKNRSGKSDSAQQPNDEDIARLKSDLSKSSELLKENDTTIANLNQELLNKNERLLTVLKTRDQLTTLLTCTPETLIEKSKLLVNNNTYLRTQLNRVSKQLAAAELSIKSQQSNTAKQSNQETTLANKGPESNVRLTNPKNATDASDSQSSPTKDINSKGPSIVNKDQSEKAIPTNQTEKNQLVLLNKIHQLEVELKNREKLLAEQTTWIESIRKKNGRIETSFRNDSNSVRMESVVPFRDRGTFKISNQ